MYEVTDSLVYVRSEVYFCRELGQKQYELSNHLGNVLVTVSDKKIYVEDAGSVDHFLPEIMSISDYYHFGSPIVSRAFACGEYRYGMYTQEKDDEIYREGNSYSAEYWQYDARLGRRWNVDPVVYHWQSCYTTFDNNPIWKIDPLGLFASRKDAREYRNDNNLKGRVRIDNEGHYSIDNKKELTSIYRDIETGNVYTAVLISEKSLKSKNITPFGIGVEWLTGGKKSREFTQGDYTVELYKKHKHYKDAYFDAASRLKTNNSELDYSFPFELSGVDGIGKYVNDYSTLLTGGTTGNLMFTYLGSHSLWIEVTAIDINNRVAIVTFTVHNMSTLESATRLPYFGYQQWYMNTIGVFLNTVVAGKTGPMSETEQVFQWEETIKY